MGRKTFNILAGVAWVCVLAGVVLGWDSITWFSTKILPRIGTLAVPTVMFAGFLLAVALHLKLADIYVAPEIPRTKDLTPGQKRERAHHEAQLALKQGRVGTAMLIYEEAGMYRQAYKLAEQLGNKPGQARLSCRLGYHSRARRIYLDLKDYEAAANTSAMMGEIATAREYYRKALEAWEGKATEAQEAGLWERAGELVPAAGLYEKAGDLERAAECHKLMGDTKNFVRCDELAKVVAMYEEKQRNESRHVKEHRIAQEKAKAAVLAKEMEEQGDFLDAGVMYRKAGLMMEAAMAFERFEEWERAAEAYEKAGLKERAEFAKMHVEAKKAIEEEEAVAELPAAPTPTPPSSSAFVPITRAPAIPVYLGIGGAPPSSPELRLEVCRRVRRGNFVEAAEFAKSAGDWVMAAAYYERAGNHIAAADVYRQIGDINAAAYCLVKGGRPREAAFMQLAIGQSERAVEVLLKAIESRTDLEENALTLGELLIQWGKYPLALEFLRKLIPPESVDEAEADVYYQFARHFEDEKAWREARALYRDLISAGAQSDEIRQCEARLAELLAQPPGPEPPPEPNMSEAESAAIDSMLRVALQEFAGPRREEKEPLLKRADRTKVFQFTPGPELLAASVAGAPSGPGKTTLFPVQEISLFGHAVGDLRPAGPLDAGGESLIEASGLGPERSDPFAPSRRYEIKGEIGRGGMGVVYETLDTVLGRRVALKLILNEAANPEGYGQFLVEARAIALLSHPNVVTIYDIGLIDMRHYIAMEFVDGGSLGRLIRSGESISLKEALRIFIEISRGLQTAHEAGIVHRDIKPENVLLNEKRQVKLSDFGLAKIRRKSVAQREKTTFEISGTPGFMAPEQVTGEDPHPRFDIYALGITLFTMLVGKPPHEIVNKTGFFDIVQFQASGDMPPLRRFRPTTPEAVEQVYQYCTVPNPDHRYQSIDAFLPAVERIAESL